MTSENTDFPSCFSAFNSHLALCLVCDVVERHASPLLVLLSPDLLQPPVEFFLSLSPIPPEAVFAVLRTGPGYVLPPGILGITVYF